MRVLRRLLTRGLRPIISVITGASQYFRSAFTQSDFNEERLELGKEMKDGKRPVHRLSFVGSLLQRAPFGMRFLGKLEHQFDYGKRGMLLDLTSNGRVSNLSISQPYVSK